MITAPAAKVAMLALLQASTTLTDLGVTIEYGAPTRTAQIPDNHRMVHLGRVTAGSQEWAALGRQRHREDYRIELVARVWLSGDDEPAVETLCTALYAAAIEALKLDPTLGRLLDNGFTVEDAELVTDPTEPAGWVSVLTAQVACEATVVTA